MSIRDQSYDRYDGPLRQGLNWAVIGWSGFRTYWSFWRTKLTLFAVWLIPVIFGLLIIVEAAFADGGATPLDGSGQAESIGLLLDIQLFALALVFIARGCNIISDDLRHGTLQLYFSKPVSRLDYAGGKLLTLVLLGTVAVLIPSALLAAMRTAFLAQTQALGPVIAVHAQALAMVTILVVLVSSIVIGLSSLTRRTGYAVLAIIALLVVPLIVQIIVGVTSGGSPWTRLISLNGMMGLATDALIGGPDVMPDEIPRVVPFIAIAAVISAGLGALRWRLANLHRVN